jgi:hypothetical protein
MKPANMPRTIFRLQEYYYHYVKKKPLTAEVPYGSIENPDNLVSG